MATGNINKIESVQRRFTKRLSGLSKLCYESRLTVVKTESLERKRLRADLIICYKILNGIVHVNRDSFFVMTETSRTRGHSMKLYKPNGMSSFYATYFLDSYF